MYINVDRVRRDHQGGGNHILQKEVRKEVNVWEKMVQVKERNVTEKEINYTKPSDESREPRLDKINL